MNTQNSLKQVATATMVGTAIEYFDNYIYAMAAVLVFNHQFFHAADPLSGQIAALSTLALTLLLALWEQYCSGISVTVSGGKILL